MASQQVRGTLENAVETVVEEVNRLGVDVAAIKTKFDAAVADITAMRTNLGKVVDDLTAMRTTLSAHVHGGITAGSASTSAIAALDALTSGAPAALTSAAAPALTKKGLKNDNTGA